MNFMFGITVPDQPKANLLNIHASLMLISWSSQIIFFKCLSSAEAFLLLGPFWLFPWPSWQDIIRMLWPPGLHSMAS